MSSIVLRGISWDHPRGLAPLRATLTAHAALAPGVRIEWQARSLLGFGEDPLEELARRWDLLVIDHPFAGLAAATGCLLPLDTLLPSAALERLAGASVGPSFESYSWSGHLWALPMDTAAQVAVVREDLLDAAGVGLPRTWPDVLALGHRLRQLGLAMAMPMIHTDLVPTFYTLAASLGEEPLAAPTERVLTPAHLDRVLDLLVALRDACDPDSSSLDPPALLERMSSSDQIAYCPLAFGYSNYSRAGFRPARLRFVDIPMGPSGRRATLGGAGIAVSAHCDAPAEAALYSLWLAGEDVQRGPYFEAGGQPAHRAAWLDPRLNEQTLDFFRGTLDTLDHAFLRPRWPGYMTFQDLVGPPLYRFVRGQESRRELVGALEEARVESQRVRALLEAGR